MTPPKPSAEAMRAASEEMSRELIAELRAEFPRVTDSYVTKWISTPGYGGHTALQYMLRGFSKGREAQRKRDAEIAGRERLNTAHIKDVFRNEACEILLAAQIAAAIMADAEKEEG